LRVSGMAGGGQRPGCPLAKGGQMKHRLLLAASTQPLSARAERYALFRWDPHIGRPDVFILRHAMSAVGPNREGMAIADRQALVIAILALARNVSHARVVIAM